MLLMRLKKRYSAWPAWMQVEREQDAEALLLTHLEQPNHAHSPGKAKK
jgi:hypothetical protein